MSRQLEAFMRHLVVSRHLAGLHEIGGNAKKADISKTGYHSLRVYTSPFSLFESFSAICSHFYEWHKSRNFIRRAGGFFSFEMRIKAIMEVFPCKKTGWRKIRRKFNGRFCTQKGGNNGCVNRYLAKGWNKKHFFAFVLDKSDNSHLWKWRKEMASTNNGVPPHPRHRGFLWLYT